MSNTFFQFKQFTVHQEHTAMKVCTDACLFGAWVANDAPLMNVNKILDIGSGTGLLSLMLAQAVCNNVHKESGIQITAIEIEPDAAKEAASNCKTSPWATHIQVVNNSIQSYSKHIQEGKDTKALFECIISNPPFFESDLPSPNANVNLASHSSALPWTELIQEVDALLQPNGNYFVLVPALRAYTMQKLAEQKGFQLVEEVMVYNAAKQKPLRAMQKFIKSSVVDNETKRSNFIIKDAEHHYTERFIKLLAPYYLHL